MTLNQDRDAHWGPVAHDFLPEPTERRGQILHPFAIPCMQGVLALNVTRGCSHSCVYCYCRAYPEAPAPGQLPVYGNLPAQLEAELGRMRRLPRAVSLCTASDPFQPLPAVLDVTYRAAEFLLARGIAVTFLTKGWIPDPFVALFARYAGQVRARIGLLSLDPAYHRRFEPGTAFPEARLENIRRLRAAGVPVGVRHDPMIPGITDRPEHLDRLLRKLAAEGISHMDTGYLYIRPGIARLLADELPPAMARAVLGQFRRGPVAPVAASAATQLLPADLRARSFFRLRMAAREYGITPLLCRCKNPDLEEATRCQGSRELAYPAPPRRARQLSLGFAPCPVTPPA